MPLDLPTVRRFSRQIALPAIGPEGQAKLCAAEVMLVGLDDATETAARYLVGAGVRRVRVAARDGDQATARLRAMVNALDEQAQVTAVAWPADGAAWVEALRGTSVVVRSGFDDDPMLRAAVRVGVPVIALRARPDLVDVLAFRKHGPCPHATLEVPTLSAQEGSLEGATAVVAGTLAAAEVAQLIVQPGEPPRARHLRWPMGAGQQPREQEIPWAPECFACGGEGREVVLS